MHRFRVKTVVAPPRARLLIAVFIASLLAIPASPTAVLHAAGTVETSVNVSESAAGLSEAPQISLNNSQYAISWGERATSSVGTADGALDANPGARQVLTTGTSTKTQFPDIAVGADGTEHLTYIVASDIFYRHRTLGGTWSNAIKVASDDGPNPVRMAVAPNGTIWVVWRDKDGTHVAFRYSNDGGTSWNAGGSNGIIYAEPGNIYSFDIGIGTDNIPHVVWYVRGTGPNKGEIEYGDWNGSRFSQAKLTNDGSALYDADPVISVDGNNVQHVAWRKQASGAGDTLYYAQRSSGGQWSDFTPLGTSGATFQYAPGIGTDANGSVYITFSQLLNGGRSVYIAAKPSGQATWNAVEVVSDGYHNWETRSDVKGSSTGGTKAHIVYQSETRSDETTGEIYYKRVAYGAVAPSGPSAQPKIEADAKTTKNNPVQVTFDPVSGDPTEVRWKWGAAPSDADNDSDGWQAFATTKSIPLPSEVTPSVCRNMTLYTQVKNSATTESKAQTTNILYDAAVQATVGVRNPHLDGKLATYSQGASDGALTNTRESYYDVTIANLADCSGLKEYGFDGGAAIAWPSGENEVVQRNIIAATYDPGVRPPLPAYVVDKSTNRTDQGAVVVYDPRDGKPDAPVANSGAPVVSGGSFTVDSNNSVLRTLTFSDVSVNDTVYGAATNLPAGSQFWGVWVATSKGAAPVTDTNSDTLQWVAIKVPQPGASFTVSYSLLTGQPTGALTGREGTYWIYVKFLDGAGNPSVETLTPVQVDLTAGYKLITRQLPSISK